MSTNVHEHAALSQPPVLHCLANGTVMHEFMAWLLPGVMEQKLINLVVDLDADVKKVSDGCFELRLGKKLLLMRAYSGEEVPVQITLLLHPETRCVRSMTHVEVVFKPLGRVDREPFKKRCGHLISDIHACLLGHPLERIN